MFGLGLPEIIIILVIALLVFGPQKLPELARNLGRGIREFRKASSDFQSTLHQDVYREEPPAVPEARQLPQTVEHENITLSDEVEKEAELQDGPE